MPFTDSPGSKILASMVDFPALSRPINNSLADELPISIIYIKEITTTAMDFGDELPCGGYQDEDKKIQDQIKLISEEKQLAARVENCGMCECEAEGKRQTNSKICKKCLGKAVLFHKGEPICQACLFKNMQYKTRLLLENTFKVNKNSNLLICFSGGLSSICLVSIIVNIVKRYQKNKLFNRLGCIHIQQQTQLPEGFQAKFQKYTGVQLNIIKIEEIMKEGAKNLQNIKQILKQFNSNANTIDLITIFRDRLIIDFAKTHNYDFVLKGLNGQSLATQSFCYFAKGLGGNIPGLCTSEQTRSYFYYPLRNHSRKQLQYYYYIKKISNLAVKSEDDNIQNFVSSRLNDQIKGFIDTLQQMYSHTAPAIVRTAQKIETNLPSKKECSWCLLPGAEQKHLCRRCLRIWQGRKKTATLENFPLQLNME